ncbi:MAG: hypothetical protein R3A52_05515 [Polyangiales bacterium]
MTMAKWILHSLVVASLVTSAGCRSRRRDDDNNGSNNANNNNNNNANNNNANNQAPQQPQQPQQPQMPQQPVAQPQMPQQPQMPTADPNAPQQPAMPGNDMIPNEMTRRQGQFAAGMTPVLPLTRGTLATGASQNYAVTMTPGQCYKIIGVGGPGVIDLDLKLYDPQGNMVDQDIATDNFPVIGLQHPLCPTTAGQYRLEALMYSGQGEFGVQVFGRPAGQEPQGQPAMPQGGGNEEPE